MEPWEDGRTPWKTKASYFSWLRGVLRKGWNNSPVKVEFAKNVRHRIKNPNPKGRHKEVWGHTCNICGCVDVTSKFQVDHKDNAGSLKGWEDVGGFTKSLLGCSMDDLQMLCKTCHDQKSYAERYNVTFEEAGIKKQVSKVKQMRMKELVDMFTKEGYPTPSKYTKTAFVNAYEELLRKGEDR